jgi:hypothetical protein
MTDLLVRVTGVCGWEHVINEAAMQLGRMTGYYVALCGFVVWPASLTAPPGKACRACYVSPLL